MQSSLSQHYVINNTITLSGDFEIEIDFQGYTAGTRSLFGGGPSAGQDFLAFFDATSVSFAVNGDTLVLPTPSVDDGKLHNIKLSRVGSLLSGTYDGGIASTLTTSETCTIDLIGGNNQPSNLWDGIIANLKITDGSTLTHDLAFDTDLSNTTIVNKGTIGATGNATTQNLFPADAELYEFDGSVSPNTWTGEVTMNVIEVAGT